MESDPKWAELERFIDSISAGSKPSRVVQLKKVFKSAIRLARDNPGTLNLKIAATTLQELQLSFKMFYKYRYTPKITVFGSARVPPKDPVYKLAKEFGKLAVKKHYMLITGGGPGAMAAGNEGAGIGGSFGLNIRLPMEQGANPFIDQKRHLINYKYFYTRKLFLIKEAVALVLFPGGFGTFDEAFELLTLLQTGKTNPIPVVFLEPKGYRFWERILQFLTKEWNAKGFIDRGDQHLYKILHTPKQALDHIDRFYKNYHSIRVIGELLAIRLKRAPTEKQLAALEMKFGYLATDGKFRVTGAHPEEENEPELKHLARLVLKFAKKDFSNLRLLIDVINDLPE